MESKISQRMQFDELEIWRSISRSWKTLNRDVEHALSPTGLSLAEVKILRFLHEDGPLPITKLASELLVTPGAVTSLIDGLEKQELVARLRSESDRRVVTIRITSTGEATIKKAIFLHRQYLAKKFQSLSKKDAVHLAGLLYRLANA